MDFGEMLRGNKDFQLQPAGREQKLQAAFTVTPHTHMLDHKALVALNGILEQLKEQMDYFPIDIQRAFLFGLRSLMYSLKSCCLFLFQAKRINQEKPSTFLKELPLKLSAYSSLKLLLSHRRGPVNYRKLVLIRCFFL